MIRSRALKYLLLASLVLALLPAAVAWLATREATLRWLSQEIVAASGGRIAIGRVEGSLLGPVRFFQVSYRGERLQMQVDQAEADWTLLALLQGKVRVRRVELGEVRVKSSSDGSPAKLPEDLTLPLPVAVQRLAARRIAITGASGELVLEALDARFESDGSRHSLELRNLDSPYGRARVSVSMDGRPPFALQGEGRLTLRRNPLAPAVGVTASGELARILLDAVAESDELGARASIALAPFEPEPVRTAAVAVDRFDPSQVDKALPQAQISGRLQLDAAAPGMFKGRLSLGNSSPGPLDAGRLPVAKLESRLDGTWDAMDLRDLVLGLAGAGELTGHGRIAADGVSLELTTGALDLSGVHRRMRPTRLAGTLALKAGLERQSLDLNLTQSGYRLQAAAVRRGDRLTLKSASIAVGGGTLEASGTLSLAGAQAFNAKGLLRNFDPSAMGNFPAARINAALSASGKLSPQWQAAISYDLAGSRYSRQPLAGKGQLTLTPKRLAAGDGTLELGDNRVAIKGSFGAAGDRLAWTLDAPRLEQLGAGVTGSAQGSGAAAGSLAQPRFEFELEGRRLTAPGGVALLSLDARGQLEPGPAGTMDLTAAARSVRLDRRDFGAVTVEVKGTRAAHTAALSAKGSDVSASARLEGGFGEGWRWAGRLLALDAQQPQPVRLGSPARLVLGPNFLELGPAQVSWNDTRLALDSLTWTGQTFAARGRFQGLPAAWLLKRWLAESPLESTMQLAGEWDLNGGATLNGTARVWRESGAVTIKADAPENLGLTDATLEAIARDGALTLALRGSGTTLGSVAAQLETRVVRRGNAWEIPVDAPIDGDAQLAVPSLTWVGPIISPDLRTAGALGLQVVVAGTLARPRFRGGIAITDLAVRQPDAGIFLSRGTLNADIETDRIVIREGVLLTRDGGRIDAQGVVSLQGSERLFELRFKADKLALIQRPDRRVETSGGGVFWVDRQGLALEAKLKVDRGFVDLGALDRPSLSDDVIIEGRSARAGAGGRTRLRMDLEFDLGNDFLLRGAGVDGRLTGGMKIRSDGRSEPVASGTLRIVDGTYTAYGQQITIERGLLNFTGPVENPALDILALRKNQQVEAGVQVTGTARSPRVRLVSIPNVPDREKLSWLVFGKGGEPMDVSLNDPTRAASQSVGLGTRLSKEIYVAYEQSITGTENLFKIFYTLSQRWSVRTEAGSDNAIRLFYTLSFD